jgi:hypothetical protein
MPIKPTTLPEWASDPGADIVEPALAQKQDGWDTSDRPPAQFFNWWQNNVFTWVQFVNAPVGQAGLPAFDATGGSSSGTGIKATGGSPNGIGLHGVGTGSGEGVLSIGGATDGTAVKGTAGGASGRGVLGIGSGANGFGVHGVAPGITPGSPSVFTGGHAGFFEGLVRTHGRQAITPTTAEGLRVDGIGSGQPAAILMADTYGVLISAGGFSPSVFGSQTGLNVTGGGTGLSAGIRGVSNSTTAGSHGVIGEGAGANSGVSGTGGPSSGVGVEGTAGGALGIGVKGTATSGDGVQGFASGSGSSSGVYGRQSGSGFAGFFQNVGTGYGLVAEADTTAPVRAAFRIVPQDTAPTTALKGDLYVQTGGSDDGKLKIFNGTAWVTVGGQAP